MQYNQTLCPILLERHTGNHMQVPAIYLKYVHRKYAVKCLVWNFVRKNPPNIESNINEISYFGKYIPNVIATILVTWKRASFYVIAQTLSANTYLFTAMAKCWVPAWLLTVISIVSRGTKSVTEMFNIKTNDSKCPCRHYFVLIC